MNWATIDSCKEMHLQKISDINYYSVKRWILDLLWIILWKCHLHTPHNLKWKHKVKYYQAIHKNTAYKCHYCNKTNLFTFWVLFISPLRYSHRWARRMIRGRAFLSSKRNLNKSTLNVVSLQQLQSKHIKLCQPHIK